MKLYPNTSVVPASSDPAARGARWSAGRIFALAASPGFLLVLVAFFLPWYSVSCAGRVLATGTGFDAATTGLRASEDSPLRRRTVLWSGESLRQSAATDPRSARMEGHGATWMGAFPLLALAGLALSLAVGLRGASSRLPVAGAATAALLGCALQTVHLVWLRGRLVDALAGMPRDVADAASRGEPGGTTLRATVRTLAIDPSSGWYLALIGGAAAALFAVLAVVLTRAASTTGGRGRPPRRSVDPPSRR